MWVFFHAWENTRNKCMPINLKTYTKESLPKKIKTPKVDSRRKSTSENNE